MASRYRFLTICTLSLLLSLGVALAFSFDLIPGTLVGVRATDIASDEAGSIGAAARAEGLDGERHSVALNRATGPWTAGPGDSLEFDVRSATTFLLTQSGGDSAAEGSAPVTLRWRARLTWIVHDRDREHILSSIQAAEFAFQDVPADDPELAARARAMQSTSWLRMNVDGEVTGIRFATGISSDGQDFLRSVVALLGYRVGDADGQYRSEGRWTVEESDNTGRYAASYRRLPPIFGGQDSTFERRRLRYLRVNEMVGEVPKHELAGSTKVRFADGWLTSVDGDQRTKMGMPGLDGQIDVHIQTTLRRTAQSTVTASRRKSLAELRDGFLPAGGESVDWALDPKERLDSLRAELGDRSLTELVDALRAALNQHGVESREVCDLWASIGHLIEVHPELAAELAALVRVEGGRGPVAEQLLSALGAAGNQEAQHQLVGLTSDTSLDIDVRERAVVATHQIAKPEPELMDSLFERVRSPRSFDGLAATSVLALGTLSARATGHRTTGPRLAAVGTQQHSALQRLLAQEERATRGGWLDTWLESLGNSEQPEILPTLLRYAKHMDSGLRGVAARVLPRIADPRVVPALLERVKLETEVGVRRGLADSLGACPAGPADVALRGLAKETNELVVLHAIQALGRRLTDANNHSVVTAAMRTGSTKPIRDLAKAALDAHRQSRD